MANFRVDLRDDTPIASQMQQVLDDFNVPGIMVYADNAFVSVAMLCWCKERGINLCGTTRRDYGFPDELQFDGMQVYLLYCNYFITDILCILLNTILTGWRQRLVNVCRRLVGHSMARRWRDERNVCTHAYIHNTYVHKYSVCTHAYIYYT